MQHHTQRAPVLEEAELYLLRKHGLLPLWGLQGQSWSRPPINTIPQCWSCEPEQLFLIAGGKYHHNAWSVKVFFSVALAWLKVSWLPFCRHSAHFVLNDFSGQSSFGSQYEIETQIVVPHSLHVTFANYFGKVAANDSGGINPT